MPRSIEALSTSIRCIDRSQPNAMDRLIDRSMAYMKLTSATSDAHCTISALLRRWWRGSGGGYKQHHHQPAAPHKARESNQSN